MATTLVVIDTDGNKHYLDVLKGQPVTLDFNFKDITDLKTKGSHSYNFRLPSSENNDKFFSSYYMVGSYNDGTNNNYDPYKKVEAYLLEDTIEVFSGSLQLSNVYLRAGNRYEYEVILYSKAVGFIDDFKGVNVSDIDLTDYDHLAGVSQVANSWISDSIASGKVVYSLYDYGTGAASSLASTFVNEPSGATPLGGENMFNVSKLRPQVQLRDLFTKILAHKGYVYNSTFLDSSEFGKIYVDANYNGADNLETEIPNSTYNVLAYNSSTFIINYGQTNGTLQNNSETIDLLNNYDTSTYRFNPSVGGTYSITVGININPAVTLGAASPAEIRVVQYDNNTGTVGQTYIATLDSFNIDSGINSITINQVQLEVSKYYEIQLWTPYLSQYSSIDGTALTIANSALTLHLLQSSTGVNEVTINALLSGLKAVDFIKSVIRKFNLIVIPDKHNKNELYIEPYNDYMQAGGVKDWSTKLDFTKDVQIVPPTKFAGRNVVFEDEPSEDYIYQSFEKIYPFSYGSYTEYLGNEFAEKDSEFTSIFSPTIAYPIEVGGFYTSPIMKPEEGEFKNTGGIRLSFYHGKKTIPNDKRIRLTDTISQTTFNSGIEYTTVPYFSPFSEQDFTNSNTVYTINWGCTLTDDLVTWETIPLQGLASKYWLSYIRNNFDKNARMLIAYMHLTPRDIADFNFNDTIKINGEDYIVNSIKQYPVSNSGLCKVELLKTFGTYYLVAEDIDCGTVEDYYAFHGVIKHYDTGLILDDQTCCERLGFYYYNGVWGEWCYNTPDGNNRQIATPRLLTSQASNNNIIGTANAANFSNGGSIRGSFNEVITGGREITIYGDNNKVKTLCSQINITGDDNVVSERVEKSNITGNDNAIFTYRENQELNGEKLLYTNALKNINITGVKGKGLNNNETILASGKSGYTLGSSQSSEFLIETTVAGGTRDAWIGQQGSFTAYPNSDTYNSDLGHNALRLPDKAVIKLRITLQATTGTTTNTLNSETWEEVNEYKIISGTAPILVSSTQVSSSQTTEFVNARISLHPCSNIPYLYNGYLLYLALPFATLVNDTDFNIKVEYISTPLIGTVTSNILPTDISGLKLWLDAANFSSLDFNSTVGDNQPIKTWHDKSGNSNDVAQSNSTYMPRWRNGGTVEGRPFIDFDGTTAVLTSTDTDLLNIASGDNTFIAVFESDTTISESYGQIVTGINTSSGTPRAGINVNPNGTYGGASNDSVSYYNENTTTNMFQCNINTAGVTDPKIVVGRRNGVNLDIIDENGNTDTYTTASSPTDAAYYTVGARWNGTVDYAEFNGKIHEIIVYDNKLSDSDRDKLIYYLKNKWNIQ